VDLIERQADSSGRHPWEIARAGFFEGLIARTVPAGAISVLDVGSGDAWLAAQLVEGRPDTSMTCWDLNYTEEDLAELPLAHPEINFGTTPGLDRFEGILMLDVIEHVEDDREFVRSIVERNLADDGWILISVPAYQSLFVSHDRYLRHYRRYSPAQGRTLLESVGLSVEAEGGLFHSLLPARGAVALKEKLRPVTGDSAGVGAWTHGKAMTSLVTAALSADARFSLWMGARSSMVLPGLSYWAFCRRAQTGVV